MAKRDGERPEAVQERFATVLGQVLAGLPAQSTEAARELAELREGAASTLAAAELATVLTTIGKAVSDAGQLAIVALPVTGAGTGATPGAVVADHAVAGNLLREKLGMGAAAGDTPTSG
jgi:hypothetical protein